MSTWLSLSINCYPNVEECPEVQLKNGMVQYSGRSSGDVISFRCNSDFVLLGQSKGICMTDGMWSGKVPVCRGINYYTCVNLSVGV